MVTLGLSPSAQLPSDYKKRMKAANKKNSGLAPVATPDEDGGRFYHTFSRLMPFFFKG